MLTSVKVINQTKFSKWDLLILKLFNCPILVSAMERFPCWSLWWTATKNQKKLEPNVLKKWPQVEGSSKKRRRREGRRGMEALEAEGPWWRWGWRVGIKRVGGPPEVIMVRGQLSSQSRPPQRCVPNSSNDWSSSVPAPHPPTHPPPHQREARRSAWSLRGSAQLDTSLLEESKRRRHARERVTLPLPSGRVSD